MTYQTFKERLGYLQGSDFSDNYFQVILELNDLAEDMLAELGSLEHTKYLFKRSVPPEVSCFYPRITKDPTISCFKDNYLIGLNLLENPDFTKLHELGIYALSDGDYYIRTVEQLGYISKFLEGEMKQVVGLEGYHFYINFN